MNQIKTTRHEFCGGDVAINVAMSTYEGEMRLTGPGGKDRGPQIISFDRPFQRGSSCHCSCIAYSEVFKCSHGTLPVCLLCLLLSLLCRMWLECCWSVQQRRLSYATRSPRVVATAAAAEAGEARRVLRQEVNALTAMLEGICACVEPCNAVLAYPLKACIRPLHPK